MRLEARVKMGYYPTPLSVVERIKTFIALPKEATVLDPCCGEGLALQKISEGMTAVTYGVELDEHRAEEAKSRIHHVLKCGIEQTRISHGSFSCLFLNPPYDWETTEEEIKGSERKEKTFLRMTMPYLKAGGLLIYIIPQSRLDKSIAKILAYRFENSKVFRFPDEEYQSFKQFVLLATKKQKASMDEKLFGFLAHVPVKQLEEIPHADEAHYQLPVSKEVSLFRSTVLDLEELSKEVKKSPLWFKLQDLTRCHALAMESPPLPLHKGHIGLMLANGCLDGVVGEGEDRHIVTGKVEKIVHSHSEYKGDVLEEREVESYRVSVKILKQDGEIITLL